MERDMALAATSFRFLNSYKAVFRAFPCSGCMFPPQTIGLAQPLRKLVQLWKRTINSRFERNRQAKLGREKCLRGF